MGDFIAKYGIFAGIGVPLVLAILAFVGRHVRRKHPTPSMMPTWLFGSGSHQSQPLPVHPLDVEVIPLWFEVWLNQQIPDVRVYLQVVNYLSREAKLNEVTATYCHINEGLPLENIPAGEYRIPPRRSHLIMCRRTLLDAEAKALSALPWRDRFEAGLNVRVRGAARRKVIALDPGGFAVRGWITGLPSHPSLRRAPPS